MSDSPLVRRIRALEDIVASLPTCEACDSAPATYETPSGFRGCDEHPSAAAVDLPWADALRALAAS